MSSQIAKPRVLLEQSSIRVRKVFSKRYEQIEKKLNLALSFKRNPVFAAISMYMLYKFVEGIFKDLDEDIENDVAAEVEFAYYLGFAMGLMAYYNSMGIAYTYTSVMKSVPFLVDKTVLIAVKKTTMKDLLQITRNTEYSTKKLIQATMSKHLNIKNMNNMGRTDLANLLIKELEGKALKAEIRGSLIAIVDNAGRRWKIDNYVDMVVRTKAHQVYVKGLQDFADKNGGNGDLARIPFSPLTTDSCLQFEGMIISMTGATEGYVTYEELKATNLIFHPRCRHQPVPYWDESLIPEDVKQTHKDVLASSNKVLNR